MDYFKMEEYDVVVVGAGHAGCEAGLAVARMGYSCLLLSMNLESIAMMACNPSIGGTGKGHLVVEIDALGGEMGKNIDKSFILSKMLNTAKGPAVHSLRAQADKEKYRIEMKKTIEKQENLVLKQGEVVDLIVEDDEVKGVVLKTGEVYHSKAVILSTGTFLRGKIFIGDRNYSGGPNGLSPSIELGENLQKHGVELRRFKTGTPARALGASIDYSKVEEQKGDETIVPFSFMNDEVGENKASCWLTYTNEETHEIIRRNFSRSALFGGHIEGVGPRYCPSIEDKINRFSDKNRHQLFIEPEGLDTDEMYLQGMSTSLPPDVQEEFYRSIPGLENLRIVRYAYAIEYDCIDPQSLNLNLEHRKIANLFCAGQFNGSSGYEEAACQGLMAGINAVEKIRNNPPFILDRSEAYIGVLIDDMITKGITEPYRIMTSRSEYRLLLRQDNAHLRLTQKSRDLGLADDERYERFIEDKKIAEKEKERLEKTSISPEISKNFLVSRGTSPVDRSVSLASLLKRPEIKYEDLSEIDFERPSNISRRTGNLVEVQIKYEGYIKKQEQQVERFKKLENKRIPEDINYSEIQGIRLEARQKLDEFKPMSLGQASRLAGVYPADVNVLMIYLEKIRRKKES